MGRKTNKDIDFKRGKWEPAVYKNILDIRGSKKSRFSIEYETEKIPYIIEHVYVPDFILTFKDGRKIYLEAKGYFDALDRRKLMAVKKTDPSLDIRLVFMNDNKVHKASNMRYSDWCNKYGFPFCVKEIPKEWLE